MLDRQFFFLVQQRHRLAHVQDADNAVDLAFVDGQLVVVAGGQLALDFIDRQFQVQRLDLRAGRHDVLNRDGFQVEQVEQDAFVLLREEVAALQHDGAHFLGRQAGLMRVCAGLDAEQLEYQRDEQVDEPDHRLGQRHQRLEHHAGRQGNLFREGSADDFRRNLGKHDQQEGHHGSRDGDDVVVMAEGVDGDRGDQGGGHGVDQRVGDQHQRQQLVGALQQPQGSDGAAAAVLGHVAQAIAVGRHQGGFGHGEEGRAQYQESERKKLRPKRHGIQGSP